MREFVNSERLAAALADAVGSALRARLARDELAVLAVSGGTTPVKFFQALSARQLDWSREVVTLVDDRCVPEASERSNARLVKMHLLQNAAARATFLPLVGTAESAITALPLPLAAAVLGMGLDGHTASFFPGGDRLAAALASHHLLETISAPGAGESRVTLTLAPLLGADFLALHIEGAAKLKALETAIQPGSAEDMPVRAVLARQPGPEIFWCP